jgi:hypothetical protein
VLAFGCFIPFATLAIGAALGSYFGGVRGGYLGAAAGLTAGIVVVAAGFVLLNKVRRVD